MQAKDEELTKVKEKHLYAEQQLRDMEEKQQQVKLMTKEDAVCGYHYNSSLHMFPFSCSLFSFFAPVPVAEC